MLETWYGFSDHMLAFDALVFTCIFACLRLNRSHLIHLEKSTFLRDNPELCDSLIWWLFGWSREKKAFCNFVKYYSIGHWANNLTVK
jgi:hypothetical protein